MATQVKDNGGMEYRLSSNGLIEYYDHGCKVWCNYTIISDAEDLLLHHGRLAYKNKKGDVYFETATGWHQVVVEKRKGSKDSGDYKPKKGCVHRIIWAPFKLIWWLIKQLFHLLTLGFFR